MDWLSRWRADLARPELPTGREELPFLVLSSLTITAVARLTDDTASVVDLVLLVPALVAFAARGLLPRMPAELFAALVLGSVTLAVGRAGDLEVSRSPCSFCRSWSCTSPGTWVHWSVPASSWPWPPPCPR